MDQSLTKDRNEFAPPAPASASAAAALSWLTFEVALYGVIAVAALAVRLAALDRWPLMETGADTALAAWRAIHGSAWRPTHYVPLLYSAQLPLFWATRATDAAAALLPALVGAGLTLLPLFARDLLGRKGALAASLLLAFAPTWVFFSRTADSPILTAAASALLLLAAHRYLRNRRAGDARLGVIALALGLTSGPGIYTTLLAALLYGAFRWARSSEEERADLRAAFEGVKTRQNLFWLLGVFVLVASAFTANPQGIGASVEQLGYWARYLSPGQSDLPWYAFPRTLALYEFLTLTLAIVGATTSLNRREPVAIFATAWFALALILGLLGHRQPMWLPDALLPLVLLAAYGVEYLWNRLTPETILLDGVIALAVLAILGFTFVELSTFIQTGQEQHFTYARIAWGVLLVGWAAYSLWGYRDSASRVATAAILVVMTIFTIRAATAVAYQTARDPREPLVYQPSSAQLRDFEALVADTSSRQAGDPHILDIAYEESFTPWVAWALRDYPNAQAVASVGQAPQAMALVTAPRDKDTRPSGYMGQRFRLRETWSSQGLSFRDRLRWFIYRSPVGAEQATEIELWVRLPGGAEQ